ncbi:MAG: hypothetical protein ACRC11_00930 [Xenococcaceae cyanobacterium]
MEVKIIKISRILLTISILLTSIVLWQTRSDSFYQVNLKRAREQKILNCLFKGKMVKQNELTNFYCLENIVKEIPDDNLLWEIQTTRRHHHIESNDSTIIPTTHPSKEQTSINVLLLATLCINFFVEFHPKK